MNNIDNRIGDEGLKAAVKGKFSSVPSKTYPAFQIYE